MDNINELGSIWQSIKPEESLNKNLNIIDESVLNKLRKTEKKHMRINLVKSITVGILLVFLSYTILTRIEPSILPIIALGWIILSLIASMIVYWRKQYHSSQFEFIKDNSTFILSTIDKLKSQKYIITHLLPTMATCMVIGINLIYFDFLQEEEMSFRIIMHITITLMLYGVMFLALIVRKRRYNKDFKPLIEELELIYQNLNKD